jgi:hypothetical protein
MLNMSSAKVSFVRFCLVVSCATALVTPLRGSLLGFQNHTGSDYGEGGISVPPILCGGSMFPGVTVTCGFSSPFDHNNHDTILHFELTNSSPSFFLNSATLQFDQGAALVQYGFVDCGVPNDPDALMNQNPAVPCTMHSITPPDWSGSAALASDRSLVVSFSNISGLYSGMDRTDGITLYFGDPKEKDSFVNVTGVSTTTPEPATVTLSILGIAALLLLARARMRSVERM